MNKETDRSEEKADLERLAATLKELKMTAKQALAALRTPADGAPPPAAARDASQSLPQLAYKMRRARDEIFPNLFGEPAWDILLDLYDNTMRARPVQISSACIAASVPPTTGLRWIKVLCENGLAVKTQSEKDARSFYLTLSPEGLRRMEEWIGKADRLIGGNTRLGQGKG